MHAAIGWPGARCLTDPIRELVNTSETGRADRIVWVIALVSCLQHQRSMLDVLTGAARPHSAACPSFPVPHSVPIAQIITSIITCGEGPSPYPCLPCHQTNEAGDAGGGAA